MKRLLPWLLNVPVFSFALAIALSLIVGGPSRLLLARTTTGQTYNGGLCIFNATNLRTEAEAKNLEIDLVDPRHSKGKLEATFLVDVTTGETFQNRPEASVSWLTCYPWMSVQCVMSDGSTHTGKAGMRIRPMEQVWRQNGIVTHPNEQFKAKIDGEDIASGMRSFFLSSPIPGPNGPLRPVGFVSGFVRVDPLLDGRVGFFCDADTIEDSVPVSLNAGGDGSGSSVKPD